MSLRRCSVITAAATLATAIAFALTPAAAQASQIRVDHVRHAHKVTAWTKAPRHSGSKHWKLVYVDDFTKPLNTRTAWSVYDHGGSSNAGAEWFTPSHVTRTSAQRGQLHIKGYVDRKVMPDGRIVSGGFGLWKRPSRYGKYQVLVRMDSCADVKYAWLLWPYNNNWPKDGEIDFAEDEGGNRSLTTASLNYAGPDGNRATAPQDYAVPHKRLSGWHVIGVEWTPTSVQYTMDGRHWGAKHTSHIPRSPMVFVMQTEGKALPGHISLRGQCNADIGWVAQYHYTGH